MLETISSCAGGRPIELLRKESVASLPPARAFSILSHSYGTILPITTLPFPPLPLSLQRPGEGACWEGWVELAVKGGVTSEGDVTPPFDCRWGFTSWHCLLGHLGKEYQGRELWKGQLLYPWTLT